LGYIDLHTHTTASDGTLSPKELVEHAYGSGLTAVAITDHDTIGGIEEALSQGKKIGLEVVPGVEISVDFHGEMHILGYFINLESPVLQETLEQLREYRKERNPQIIRKLNDLGFTITLEEVKEVARGAVIGRPHIAKVLLDKGYVQSLDQAFGEYLATGRPAYVKKEKLTPQEAIAAIVSSGGLPVLAHPKYLGLTREELHALLFSLTGVGLKGIEAYYTTHSSAETQFYLALAEQHGLAVTGGSDFHGSNKPDIELGKGLGNLAVKDEVLVKLKEALK